MSARRNGRLGGCRKDACCQAYILFWKRWPFSSLVCQYIYEEKKDSIYCDAGPGARRRDREWPIGEKRSTHGLGPWSALFFDPGIWRACVWLAEAFSVHLRNSRFERSSRQLSGTHRSPLTRPRPLHFLSPLPLLPLLAARVCLPSSPPAPAFRSRSCISCSSFRLPHHSAALSPPPPTLSPHPYPPIRTRRRTPGSPK